MKEKTFIKNIADQFEDIDTSSFDFETRFKDNDEYSSLVSMSIIAIIDQEYRVVITGDNLRGVNTIGELYELVNEKKNRSDA